MYSRVNYTAIGLFMVLFIVALISFAFWLGNKGIQENYNLYLLRMRESVTGLSKDSGIKMKGVDIGSIKSITINPKNIEEVDIVLKIKKGIPIKEDMLGIIKMYGLTGLSYIEIEGGTNASALLTSEDNSSLPQIKSGVSLMGKLQNNLGDISTELIELLKSSRVLLSKDNLEKFSSILSNIDKVSSKAIKLEDKGITTLSELDKGIVEFRASMSILTKEFGDISSSFSDIEPTIKAFKKMSKSIDHMVVAFEQSVDRGDYNMQKIMTPMMIDIRELSTQMEEMTSQLEQSPNDILFKSTKPRRGPGE